MPALSGVTGLPCAGSVAPIWHTCATPGAPSAAGFFILSVLLHLLMLVLPGPGAAATPTSRVAEEKPLLQLTLRPALPAPRSAPSPARSAAPVAAAAVARAAEAAGPAASPARPALVAVEAPPPTALATVPASAPVAPSPAVPAPLLAARAVAPLATDPPADLGPPDPAALAAYSRVLAGEVGRAKRYPAVARLRGWQGTAVLSLTVSASGAVTGSALSRSSGYPLLDEQALRMLAEVMPLPAAPPGLHGRPLVIELPVVFTLAAS